LTSHSLSDRNYAEWLEEGEKPFYVDTWWSELIVTTYDQFLADYGDLWKKFSIALLRRATAESC